MQLGVNLIKQETPEIFPDVEHLNNVVPYENNTTGTKQLRYFAWPLCNLSRYFLHVGWYQQLLIAATLAVLLHALGMERRKGH